MGKFWELVIVMVVLMEYVCNAIRFREAEYQEMNLPLYLYRL